MHSIKDYYLTGDLHSAALISKSCSVDWLCFPNFDSPSVFAAILDKNAGYFKVEMPEYKINSKYIEDTGIIEFNFRDKKNEFLVRDFMVPQETEKCNNHFFIRKIIGVKGSNKVKILFNPKPDYARHEVNIHQKISTFHISIEQDSLILHLPKDCTSEKKEMGMELIFDLNVDEEKNFILEYIIKKNNSSYKGQDFEKSARTFWKNWVSKGQFIDFHKHQFIRSMITLKMMQFYPTGAIVAAPTTSLPEEIGGIRNWDYRYVWVRDATFTLYAFHIAGYTQEAEGFFNFVQTIAKRHKKEEYDINTVYTIRGDEAPTEVELKLKGYKNSSPVRIGNNATNQFQLDIYGTLIDAHYFMAKNQRHSVILDKDAIMALVNKIKLKWKHADSGIWEIREQQYHYTYSKVMSWVGVDRTLKMKHDLGLSDSEIKDLRELRSEIYNWIWENCYDSSKQNLMQFVGSNDVDATNFLFVLVQFLNKKDKMTRTIIENTYKELSNNKIFIYRYHMYDGLKGEDNSFILCIYWYISALAIMGDIDKSSEFFKNFELYINDIGLISEQIDAKTGEYLGNYPQAFSHLGLVMSIYYLNRYGKKG